VNRTAHRMWTPNVGGKRHTVVARCDPFTSVGELVLDGVVIKSWGGPRLAQPDIKFQIEERDAFLRNTLTTWDHFVDGGKVPHTRSVT
jgi:hypothetical protein